MLAARELEFRFATLFMAFVVIANDCETLEIDPWVL
jgi:hypothetical protein